jgi:hypothetical protein
MIICSHCRILAMIKRIFVIIRSLISFRRLDMTAPDTKTPSKITRPSLHTAVTLDQLVAPMEIPAELCRARWAPKWALVLPIAMLAAFTVTELPVDDRELPAPSAAAST